MGRRKIKISRISDMRVSQATFNKRRFGLMKKAYELSVLCGCDIMLYIMSPGKKLYQYSSAPNTEELRMRIEKSSPEVSYSNSDMVEVIKRKIKTDRPEQTNSNDPLNSEENDMSQFLAKHQFGIANEMDSRKNFNNRNRIDTTYLPYPRNGFQYSNGFQNFNYDGAMNNENQTNPMYNSGNQNIRITEFGSDQLDPFQKSFLNKQNNHHGILSNGSQFNESAMYNNRNDMQPMNNLFQQTQLNGINFDQRNLTASTPATSNNADSFSDSTVYNSFPLNYNYMTNRNDSSLPSLPKYDESRR